MFPFLKAKYKIILATLFVFLSILISFTLMFPSQEKESDSFFGLIRNQETVQKQPENIDIPTNPPGKLYFLMYHYVEINQDKNDFKRDSLNTPPFVFEQQVLTLKNAGFKIIKPSQIDDFYNDTSGQKYVIISFDDGYESFFTQTYPILKKHQIPAVNYFISGFTGNLNHMNFSQIQTLVSDNLVEIGSHTVNHLDLTSITSDQARYQVVESKNYFEKNFNIKITSFCYPYGFYNESLFSILEDAGYKTAVTTTQGVFYSNDNKFEIKRIRPGILTGNELISFLENLTDSK